MSTAQAKVGGIMAGAILLGTALIAYPTNIDQPPGEVRWVTDPANRKMIDGYRAACESGKPVRIDYVRSTASAKETYWIRGIAGVDGTDTSAWRMASRPRWTTGG